MPWRCQAGRESISTKRPPVILRACDFFDVVKNRGCKQNSYDDKLVINSKKTQTLSAAIASPREAHCGVEGPPPAPPTHWFVGVSASASTLPAEVQPIGSFDSIFPSASEWKDSAQD